MNAPPWPLNPSVGQMFMNWAWSGTQWIATPTTGLRVLTQVFTASGSYMPSSGLVTAMVECVGGGGCGGPAGPPPGVSTNVLCGGGGGSGGYSRKTLPATLVRGGVPVTVGMAGSNTGSPSYNGGPTSFGALCLANGGGGGGPNDGQTSSGAGGNGGEPGIGDVAFPGEAGDPGMTQAAQGGVLLIIPFGGKGGSIFGGSSTGLTGEQGAHQGVDATGNSGAGGSGACSNQDAAYVLGGNGAPGVCIVTEYCWGDVDQPQPRPPAIDVNLRPWPMLPPGPWPPIGPPGPWPRSEDDC